jgi:hypothetical protein
VLAVRGVVSVTGTDAEAAVRGIVVTFRSTAVSSADLVDRVAAASPGLAATIVSEEAAPNRRRGDGGEDADESSIDADADADAENNPQLAPQVAVDFEDAAGMARRRVAKAKSARPARKRGPTRHITLNAEDCSLEARLAAERRRLEQKESKVSSFFSKFGLW